jgi:hypothetical protein
MNLGEFSIPSWSKRHQRLTKALRADAFRLKLPLTIKQSDLELGNPSALNDSIGYEQVAAGGANMGSFRGPGGRAAADLQSYLLRKMANVPQSSVVSVNDLVDEIRAAMPSCPFSAEDLAVIRRAKLTP